MLLCTLGAGLSGNLLTGKRFKWLKSSNIHGKGVMKAGEIKIKAGQDF